MQGKDLEKYLFHCYFVTSNPTWAALGANAGLSGAKPELWHGPQCALTTHQSCIHTMSTTEFHLTTAQTLPDIQNRSVPEGLVQLEFCESRNRYCNIRTYVCMRVCACLCFVEKNEHNKNKSTEKKIIASIEK
jgi:hypothetical protein